MGMTVDDIFLAAAESRLDDLKALLGQPGAKDMINQVLDGGTDQNGSRSTFTMMFSVLNQMQNKADYAVLDELAAAGADLNIPVTVYMANGTVDIIPMCKYPITVWNDMLMLRWMLDHGADPNAYEYIQEPNGDTSVISVAAWAVTHTQIVTHLLLLLQSGADPNIVSYPLGTNHKNQTLPLLGSALLVARNEEKAQMILQFGGDPHAYIDLASTTARLAGMLFQADTIERIVAPDEELRLMLVRCMKYAQIQPMTPRNGHYIKARDPLAGTVNASKPQAAPVQNTAVPPSQVPNTGTPAQTNVPPGQTPVTPETIRANLASNQRGNTYNRSVRYFGKLQAYLFVQALLIGVGSFFAAFDTIRAHRSGAGMMFFFSLIGLAVAAVLLLPVLKKIQQVGGDRNDVLLHYFLIGLYYFAVACLFAMCITIFFAVKMVRTTPPAFLPYLEDSE